MKSCEDCFYHRSVTPYNYDVYEECKMNHEFHNGMREAEFCVDYAKDGKLCDGCGKFTSPDKITKTVDGDICEDCAKEYFEKPEVEYSSLEMEQPDFCR